LAKGNVFGAQAIGEPMVLIEAHPRREGEVRTDANEQTAPLAVEDIEVVLRDPATCVLQMPRVILADGNQDARRLARLEDDDDLVRFRPPEVSVDEVVATSNWPTHHRRPARVLAANPQTCSKWLVKRSRSS
jgi:hypothetical protein